MFKSLLYYSLFFYAPLFSEKVLFSYDNSSVFEHDFYQQIAYSEWESLDSLGKENFINSFLSKELSYIESLSLGLDVVPKNYIKLKQRHNQLLINNTYEALVAYPLIKESDFKKAINNIENKVLVHHILIGFDGCALSGSFNKTKGEALVYAQGVFDDMSLALNKTKKEGFVDVFSSFAQKYSEDPSVEKNNGFIGWVSWGQVMAPFQDAAFSLKPLEISKPILTDYGYHLILIEDKKPSDYSYYKHSLLEGFSKKMCLQTLSFDSLKIKSQLFDSALLEKNGFSINNNLIDLMFSVVQEKQKEGLRGGKSSYLGWFEENLQKEVLFIFKNKGFGVGWFLNSLKNAPATRVPSIRKKEDLVDLIKSFVVQKEALFLGKKEGIHLSSFFKEEFLKHKKNILYNEYLSFLINSLPEPDSSLVQNKYSKGLYKGEYIKPKSVVYSEIKTKTREEADSVYSFYLKSGDFDLTLEKFKGNIKNPVTLGRGGPLSSMAFDLKVGDVSGVVENTNKTFSIIRVERFVKEEPFTLEKVYKQIERKIKKTGQDSIKNNLAYNLKLKYNLQGFSIK